MIAASTRILAIDPGSERSALLVYAEGRPQWHGISPNATVLESLRYELFGACDVVVIEQIESYGMAVGREVFDTVHWSGRFTEAVERTGVPVVQLPRRTVKLAICGDTRAKDANVRQALLDRFGGSAAKGTKRYPGPLYGISADLWSALAIAVTYSERVA